MNQAWQWFRNLPSRCLILSIRTYQIGISPWLGKNCRFVPTCSAYFIESVQKYGAVRGSLRGLWRICRCHPFSRGGLDPP
ncbi:MAG: membrane protein insertion efficiency factor YidD [Pirellulaceae bacterium]